MLLYKDINIPSYLFKDQSMLLLKEDYKTLFIVT